MFITKTIQLFEAMALQCEAMALQLSHISIISVVNNGFQAF